MTAYGTWTELRYDSILYAKQAYALTMGCYHHHHHLLKGYVEPNPEFYSRLNSLVNYLKTGLERFEFSHMKSMDNGFGDRDYPSPLMQKFTTFSHVSGKIKEYFMQGIRMYTIK